MDGRHIIGLTVVALFAKHLLIVGVQAMARMRAKSFRHPEDAKLMNGDVGDPPQSAKGQQLIRNCLENEPIFVLLLYAFFSLAGDTDTAARAAIDTGTIYAGVFVGARAVHSILFLAGLAPWRTIAYLIGLLSAVGVAVQVAQVALSAI